MMEMFIQTLVKNIDIPKLLEHPKIADALALARGIARDFAEIKENQRRIEIKLDNLSGDRHISDAPLLDAATHNQMNGN